MRQMQCCFLPLDGAKVWLNHLSGLSWTPLSISCRHRVLILPCTDVSCQYRWETPGRDSAWGVMADMFQIFTQPRLFTLKMLWGLLRRRSQSDDDLSKKSKSPLTPFSFFCFRSCFIGVRIVVFFFVNLTAILLGKLDYTRTRDSILYQTKQWLYSCCIVPVKPCAR